MVGLSILDLPMPEDHYRPDFLPRGGKAAWRFETETESRAEDVIRAKYALRHANQANLPENATAAMILNTALSYGERGEDRPDSMASSVYMREQRINVIGALWQRVEEDRLPFSTVTISLPNCDIGDASLLRFDPTRMNERLRKALNGAGAIDARGWGCFLVHCDREPTTKVNRFHYHGVVTGEMIAVLDRLRKEPAFKAVQRRVGNSFKRYSPIRMSRAPITDIPRALGYLLKPYWPQNWEGEINGEAKRQARHGRIQGPAHTRALLWLDRYRLDQITLLMGLRIGRAGLVPTKLPGTGMKEEEWLNPPEIG